MAVTNNQIILTECALRGITEIVHTYAKWQELGYQVQKRTKSTFHGLYLQVRYKRR